MRDTLLYVFMYVCLFLFWVGFSCAWKSMMDERVMQLKSFGLMLKK
jgi:hypothetical protein